MQRDEPARLVNRWEQQGKSEWTGRQLPGNGTPVWTKMPNWAGREFHGGGGSQSVSQSCWKETLTMRDFQAVAAIAKSSSSSSSAATSKTSTITRLSQSRDLWTLGRRSENSFELPGN